VIVDVNALSAQGAHAGGKKSAELGHVLLVVGCKSGVGSSIAESRWRRCRIADEYPGTIRNRSSRRSLVAVAVAAVAATGLLFGACSSGNGAAKVAVKKATIELTDLPPGWSPSPAPDSVGTEGDDSRYGECLGRPDPKTVRTASQVSDEFRHGDGMRITSRTQTMRNVAAAKADLAAQRGDRGPLCLRQRLRNQVDRSAVGGDAPESVTVDRLPGLDIGDETVAFRATLNYPAGDAGPMTTYVDFVTARKGKLEVAMTFSSAQQPFPTDLERDVLNRVVGRS